MTAAAQADMLTSAAGATRRRGPIIRHPLASFFVLAYIWIWAWMPLASVGSLLPVVLAPLGPVLAAVAVSAASEGRAGVSALMSRLAMWRVNPVWYVAAIGLPVLISLLAVMLAGALGVRTATQFGTVSAFSVAYYIFAIGEELGWRGFALPRLLDRFSAVAASLVLGVAWMAWHLPLFLPRMMFAGEPLPAHLIVFCASAVLYTWLFHHTGGSVLHAVLFHGTVNASAFLTAGIDPVLGRWLQAVAYTAVAAVVVAATGPTLVRRNAS
jgi:membrane protease YdiL (CAAX protease family)